MKTFKVKIISAENYHWFADRIGEVFEVVTSECPEFYKVVIHKGRTIHNSNCEIVVDEPEQFMFQGYPLNVGDQLYDTTRGWMNISEICEDDNYPIKTLQGHSYTTEGKEWNRAIAIILYWDNPKFELPKKPMPKVKKYLVLYKGKYYYGISNEYYETLDQFLEAYAEPNGYTKAIHLILESEKEFDFDE